MAIVERKRQKDQSYIEIKIDVSHELFINMNCSEFEYLDIHVYYFDSMSTRIREFRTIKSAEFYMTANFILDPSTIPKKNF